MREGFASVLSGFLLALLCACLLSGAAFFLPRDAVQRHLQQSQGVMEKFRRADSYTECLVLGAALLQEESLPRGVFDFLQFAGGEPCSALMKKVTGQEVSPVVSYTRYWNGPVALARFVFSVFSFIPAYVLYALCTLLAFALWAAALVRRGVEKRLAVPAALGVFLGGGFIFYGANIAHAPAFFLPLLLLAGMTYARGWFEERGASFLLAAFLGGLTLYLDMLFGALPFNLLLFLLTYLFLRQSPPIFPHKGNGELIGLGVTFAFSAALMLAVKILMIGALTDMHAVLADFQHQLNWRMGAQMAEGEAFNLGALFFQHLPQESAKFFGHQAVFFLFAGFGLVAFVFAFIKNRARAFPFLLLAPIVPLWYALLPGHSWVHSFSGRLLFWPFFLGFLALASTGGQGKMALSKRGW